ncbi:MAG TPA: M20/M25/M40 family metallo-hydrolase [Armatimonadaceae bacterium]|nr:M20/M25/M40 family metallo-hydrolase [Armatimonadaceae bacterium]HVK04031.1 M20/M25/M40 family metallo-hydrolase [Armatimonadaceae bacterium]
MKYVSPGLAPWSRRRAALYAASLLALTGTATAAALLTPFSRPAFAQSASSAPAAAEPVDAAMMARIREEGMQRSQVMDTLMYLTDVIGPRLTGSPGLKRANEWTAEKMKGWGLENARLEAWGPFGRGWELKRFSAQVESPQCVPLIAFPKAWSPGVPGGSVTADVVYLDAATPADLDKYRGKLRGKVVLVSPPRAVNAWFEPMGARWTDEALKGLADYRPSDAPAPGGGPGQQRRPGGAPPGGRSGGAPGALAVAALKTRLATEEGAAAILDPGRGDGGTVFVAQASVPQAPDTPREQRLSPWSEGADKKMVPQVAVAAEHYNRLVRMVQAGEKVRLKLELAVESKVWDKGMAFNTVAEIPGSDKRNEIVMCGGHIDSWQASTGATDNGAGVAVAMEAVRILKALGVKPRRTIRVALWSGEEQGLYGSRAYVAEHFGRRDGDKLLAKPAYENLSAYFNLDNGTGKIRGVWGQGNEAVVPIFAEWLKPFHDLGATTLTLRNTGGTDHLPFDGINLPGFQFIQDRVEYDTRTHHSNQDSFDRIQADDMKQASVLMAAFLYQASMREEKLPRKPLPANVTIVPDTGKSSSVAAQE